MVCFHVCLVCKGEGSVCGGGWLWRGMKESGRRVNFPPHGAHMDTAVLWQEGHPNTLECCDPPHPRKLAGLGGMPQIAVLILIPAVLQDQAMSQGHHLRHHKPLGEIQLSISASSGKAVTDAFTSPYTNLCGNLQGFSCPDYPWGNNSDTPQMPS